MIITGFDIFKYHIPFKRAIQIKNLKLFHREGLIVALRNNHDNVGYGEIAPLPGMHKESIADCVLQLKDTHKKLLNTTILSCIRNLDEIIPTESLLPAVQYGLEAALLNMMAQNQNVHLCDLLSKKYKKKILVNALLSGDSDLVIFELKRHLSLGYRVLKLKVGKNNLEDDIALVSQVVKLIDAKAVLRLDANRSWNLNQAVEFLRAISPEKIDYLEEPLIDPGLLSELYQLTRTPLALDESVADTSAAELNFPKGVKVIIIKPSLIGCIKKIRKYIAVADDQGIAVVFSDTFHSSIGLIYNACLAASLSNKDIAMGFDTLQWLSKDILKNGIEIEAGTVDILKIGQKDRTPDFSILEKIELLSIL